MNPLVPAADAIPVSWGYFQALLMITFPIHLLFMNAMLGTTAVSLYACIKGGETHTRLARDLAKLLPFTVAFTINFGVASLLFLQVIFGHLFYTSSVLMALYWLSVPFILIVAYYTIYIYDFRFAGLGKRRAVFLLLALAVFTIPFIFTNNMTLMLEPRQWTAYFGDRGGTVLNGDKVVVWLRYLHFITGGLAIGGLFIALFGKIKGKRDPQLGELAVRIGMNMFAPLTVLQITIGFWFLTSMPLAVKLPFLGERAESTALLIAGLLIALLALGTGFRRKVLPSVALTVPLVVIMIFIRDEVRALYLKPFFAPEMLDVAPQYSPFLLFVATLMAGIATIAWMLRKTLKLYR